MNGKDKSQPSAEKKLEGFLNGACKAESEGDRKESERLFKLALFCEGILQTGVADAKQYGNTVFTRNGNQLCSEV